MFEIFHFKRDIPFMSYGKLTTTISLVTFLLSVFFLVTRPLNFSIEFTGGTVMEVRYPQAANFELVRTSIEKLELGGKKRDIIVQPLGTARDVLIRLPNVEGTSSAKISDQAFNALLVANNDTQECKQLRSDVSAKTDEVKHKALEDKCLVQRKVEFVGPSVGAELVEHGLLALLLVCVGIIIYLAIRFEWRFALSAILANMHDVVIILGFFAFFQWEFSLTVLAAVLAVLGYSVNESVVVFDRIRENFRKGSMRGRTVSEIIDNAITTTMSRTIITHGSTEMMVLAMLFLGGPSLHYFALALTIGILFGIYSSVLVASPLLLLFGVTRENMIPTVKAKEEAVP